MVVTVVGYCSVVNVVVVVKVYVRVAILFYCCRGAIVECMLCHGGNGNGGIVGVVVMMT